ncbi:MAG TPA: asparaginase, partial [Candidatus Binataceae bacterium]
ISTYDSGKGAVVTRGGAELLEHLGDPGSVSVVEFAKIPGCEMSPAKMAELSRAVARELARPDIAGAVVTHGTDTIEESAYFCHLTIASPKPLVFTGSMRTGSDLSWDGPRNLLDAITVARFSRARGIGTMLVMNEEIHSARFVTKTNGIFVGTFKSPACGAIGRVYLGEPWIFVIPALERQTVKPLIENRVATITAWSGDTESLTQALKRRDIKGLVIAGFGGGRVPLGWVKRLEKAAAKMPIVLASRTGAGAVDDPYGYGGAHFLRSIGLIAAHEMPVHKARIKLMLALGNRLSGDRLKEFIENG